MKPSTGNRQVSSVPPTVGRAFAKEQVSHAVTAMLLIAASLVFLSCSKAGSSNAAMADEIAKRTNYYPDNDDCRMEEFSLEKVEGPQGLHYNAFVDLGGGEYVASDYEGGISLIRGRYSQWRHIPTKGEWTTGQMAIGPDKSVYALSIQGTVTALSYDGTIRWKKAFGSGEYALLWVGDALWVAHAETGTVRMIGTAGSVLWEKKVANELSARLAADDQGLVYVPVVRQDGLVADSLIALDRTGRVVWGYGFAGYRHVSGPYTLNNRVFLGLARRVGDRMQGAVLRLDPQGVNSKYFQQPAPVTAMALHSDGSWFAVAVSSGRFGLAATVSAFGANDSMRWVREFSGLVSGQPMLSREHLHVVLKGEGTSIVRLSSRSGEIMKMLDYRFLPALLTNFAYQASGVVVFPSGSADTLVLLEKAKNLLPF